MTPVLAHQKRHDSSCPELPPRSGNKHSRQPSATTKKRSYADYCDEDDEDNDDFELADETQTVPDDVDDEATDEDGQEPREYDRSKIYSTPALI